MSVNKRHETLVMMVTTAVFLAVMLVLKLTGLGMIRIAVIDLTLYCVVVVVGTLTIGLKGGLILGTAFGLISFWGAMTAPSLMVSMIQQRSVPWLLVLCVVPRALIPVATYLIHKGLSRTGLPVHVNTCISAVLGSLSNTVFYLGAMLVIYTLIGINTPENLAQINISGKTFAAVLGGIVLSNGLPEAAAAGIVATPIVAAIKKMKK